MSRKGPFQMIKDTPFIISIEINNPSFQGTLIYTLDNNSVSNFITQLSVGLEINRRIFTDNLMTF